VIYRVRVWSGVTEHRVTMEARSVEEAEAQALLVLGLPHEDVEKTETKAQ
jgi:hypothetical protein